MPSSLSDLLSPSALTNALDDASAQDLWPPLCPAATREGLRAQALTLCAGMSARGLDQFLAAPAPGSAWDGGRRSWRLACAAFCAQPEALLQALLNSGAQSELAHSALIELHRFPDTLAQAQPESFLRASATLVRIAQRLPDPAEQPIGGLGHTLIILGLSIDGDLASLERDGASPAWRCLSALRMMGARANEEELEFGHLWGRWSEGLTPFGPSIPDSRSELPLPQRRELAARLALMLMQAAGALGLAGVPSMLWSTAMSVNPALAPALLGAGLPLPSDEAGREALARALVRGAEMDEPAARAAKAAIQSADERSGLAQALAPAAPLLPGARRGL